MALPRYVIIPHIHLRSLLMTIRDIESAITKLPSKKLAAFRAWFHKFDARTWDKQFEKDVKAGKLDSIANKAVGDFKKGLCQEL